MPILHCLDYFVVSFEIRKFETSRKSHFNSHEMKVKMWTSLRLDNAKEMAIKLVLKTHISVGIMQTVDFLRGCAYHFLVFLTEEGSRGEDQGWCLQGCELAQLL